MNQHEGIQCDVCVRNNFGGCRYKCLICADYDLCSDCFERGLSSGNHVATHPMQSILTRADLALYFGGEDINGTKTQCLTCPYCGELGLTGKTLLRHMIYRHPSSNESASSVLCPICAARPAGNNNYTTNNLAGHLAVEHRIVCPRSLVTCIDEAAAVALRNPQPLPTATQTRRSTSSRSSRNSMDAVFLELMSHLPDVRFDSRGTGGGAGSSTSVQALQQIQLQLQQHQLDHRLARRAFSGQLPPDFVPARERAQPPVQGPVNTSRRTSSSGRSRDAAALALQAAIASEARRYTANGNGRRNGSRRGGFVEPIEITGPGDNPDNTNGKNKTEIVRPVKPEDNDKFILKKFLRQDLNEVEHAHRDHSRADRSLFVQALLLSAFSSDFHAEQESPAQVEGVKLVLEENEEVTSSSSQLEIREENYKKKKIKKNKCKKQYESFCAGGLGQSNSKASVETQSLSDGNVSHSTA